MRLKSFFIFSLFSFLSFSVVIFEASAQKASKTTTKKTVSSSKTKPPVVQKLDMEGLKRLLQRDASNPRPLLVNFWATWCDPCREEFPDLVKIDSEYRAKGLDFVIISLDDLVDIKTSVPQFLKEMKATMPSYLLHVEDQSEAIAAVSETWGGGLPATFLFDPQGQITFSKTGIIKLSELKDAINKVLPTK